MALTKRYGWLIGFLGFGGFLGIEGEPLFLLLFAGFGGFAYYWWNKFDGTDERLYLNRYFAASNVFPWTLVAIFGLSLVLGILFSDLTILYRAELLVIALGFAVSANAWAYLTYRLDQGRD